MTDLERRLRDVLHDRASGGSIEPRLAPRIARRTRRRQIATVATALLGVTAVVVGTIAGLGAITSLEPDRDAASDEEVGMRTVTLSIGTIAYPAGWHLVEFPAGDGRGVLQLTNFEVGFSQPCFLAADPVSFPSDGALLMIDTTSGSGGERPMDLTYDPAPSACRPGGSKELGELADDEPEHLEAAWSTGSAHAILGVSVTDADRATLHEAFSGFIEDPDPTAPRSVSARLVLDVLDTPIGETVLSIDRIDASGDHHVSVSGAVPGFGLVLEDQSPIAGESTTGRVDEWGAIVAGVATTDAARAELRTSDGATFPAFLVPLPASLGLDGQQAVWGIIPAPTEDFPSMLLYDANGDPIDAGQPIVEARTTIAEGVDPEGVEWRLYLERTTDGSGIYFGFGGGSGGGGCCLSPLRDDFALDGYGSGGGRPSDITAIGSEDLESVRFESVDGTVVDGEVYPIPDRSLGVPKVALVIVPRSVPLEGTVIGYASDGTELGRAQVGQLGEPPGPTPEIDLIWHTLRSARDALMTWAERNDGSFEGANAATLAGSSHEEFWIESGEGKPVPGKVAIRGVMPAGGDELTGHSGWTLVLVSATEGARTGSIGQTYCIAVNVDDGGGGNFRYGLQDAGTYAECRGGWNI